jgi:hypothetical protein
MKTRYFAAHLLAVALLAGSGLSVAAEPAGSAMRDPSMMRSHMAMGHHMMGASGMNAGPMMMMGHLPPGNEKLELQMHGEMMKAMGDIMLKYADRIQTPPSK